MAVPGADERLDMAAQSCKTAAFPAGGWVDISIAAGPRPA